ncbi:MAG TPA: 50S ribosomal protein L11 methyltransferase [Hyphomicrobiaceae bacterium]|nr:50S ribosomal protein L11 methyltransferase [Hyphomicrobiaceae bacterium]
MGQIKARLGAKSYDEGRSLSSVLSEALDPPPLAVSMFEDGPPRHVVEAYFDDTEDRASIAAAIAALLPGVAAEIETVPDENWVAVSQAALPPVSAGRFVVHGSHDAARIGRRITAILIDAGEAFGTAHHATTLGCLHAIDRLTRRRNYRNVLDLGTGSGVLAVAAAQALPAARVAASDNDPIAIEVAAANARRNREGRRIGFHVAEGFRHPALRHAHAYDLVIANILANPLIALARDMRRAVRIGGDIVLSGLLVPQAAEVRAAYHAQGFALVQREDIAGWSILTLRRRS